MRCHHDGGASVSSIDNELVHKVTPALVEPRMRLVKQPKGGASNHYASEGDPSALPGAQARDGNVMKTAGHPKAVQGRKNRLRGNTRGGSPKLEVLHHREIVIEGRVVAEKSDGAAHGRPIDAEVMTQDFGRA